ncbi:hypothetical protein [uncultured Gammaproteobacteria bacterium]|uniref:hypothetical protein n=1 Tax=thiotrophic endosymbiont of Bathymodiolus puteoserpentis (Logatchev) TaxID=343240 RepID=UPI0010B738F0|nr:hypothetical protein [thiotrophic endosymbiont of Bathymodiolus puteoserpentis (Logatchev)]CAC9647370.1 hypothetical protein [uncultured Gammaproteobacteria bacterium]CAC9995929.1 hypothetical protein [uncultured Gammaproteobacteria bacterium]SSC10425.1 hypothetical protein BPUTEOSOX_197 [thiotrophic endosymbiont of Bathymodiolus puteoserpentis (Logatchev)]
MQNNTKIMMATTAILTVLGVGIYLLTQGDSNALIKTNNIGNDAIIKDNSNLKNIVSNNKNKSLKKIKQNGYYSHYNPKLTNLENWKLWLNNLKNGDSSYNSFEKRIDGILRNLPAGDNIFYSDIYDLFLHDTPSGPKKLIISILGSAATKESAELLYKLINDGLLIEVGDKHGSSDEELVARRAIRSFANQKWVYGKPNRHVAKVMEKNWQGLQNIMLYRATADSLAYIGEDSSLVLFFDEFLSVTDPIKIKILNQSVKNFTRGGSNPQIKDKLKHHLGSFKENNERSRIQRQVSGLLLATTGDARDKEAVLRWAQEAPGTDAEQAREFFIAMFEDDSREDSDLISKHISRERINSPLIRQVIEEEIVNTNNRQQAFEEEMQRQDRLHNNKW